MTATKTQTQRLIFEGLACAVVLANLRNAPMCYVGTEMLYGDKLRPYLTEWFLKKTMPDNVKTFLIETFVKPECDNILARKGRNHGVTDYIFQNLSTKEADIIIKEFVTITDTLRKDHETMKNTIAKTEELSKRKNHANETAA